MKIEIVEGTVKVNSLVLTITHGSEVINWNVSSFDRRAFYSGYDVFKYINQYWVHLDELKTEKIFALFKKIMGVFEDIYDVSELIYQLIPLVSELFEEHKLDEIKQWMSFHSDITFPYKLDDIYVVDFNKPSSRDKTYLKSDYISLISMAIALRIMVPIWGEFIYRTKRETGTDFKEFYALYLLEQSYIMNSEPMEKLKTYVLKQIPDDSEKQDKPINASILNGVGSENYPTWLLAKVLINRLCVGDVSGTNPSSSLVTFIWNFVNHKITNVNIGSYASMIKAKKFENDDAHNDHNASRLEGYKIKTELPLGDVVILEEYMNNPIKVAMQLKPDIDLELLNNFLFDSRALYNEKIHRQQITLAQYVLKPVISPRGLMHISKIQTINAIAIAQTVLWQSGHKIIASLMSAINTNSDGETMLSGIDSRARIPTDLIEELNIYYPFAKVTANRKKGKVVNTVIGAIEEITQLFGQRDWLLTLRDEYIIDITGKASIRRFSCPHDIKVLLAKLILELVKSR